MTPLEIGIIGTVVAFVLLFSGMPLGLAFAVTGFFGYAVAFNMNGALGVLKTVPFATFSDYTLSVIPLFILMGALAFSARLSEELYQGARGLFGSLRGGLAMTTVAACGAFAAISGSMIATAATMCKVALPEMRRYRYDNSLATGCIAAGGTIGILIPPSIMFILYGIMAEQSIGKLYLAGFIPGIIQVILFITAISLVCWRNPAMGPPGPKTNLREKLKSILKGWSALVLFLITIGGIYAGWFSANEAAGIGAFCCFLIGLGLRRLTWTTIKEALLDTAKTTSMVFLIMTGALIFNYFLTVTGVSQAFAESITSLNLSKYVVIIFIIILYLILGALMDELAMILITVPLFFPLVTGIGWDPIWFGVIVVMACVAGGIAPPVGMNVFVIHGMAKDVPMFTIYRGVMPFLAADVILMFLLVAFPEIALFLPSMMKF